MDTLVQIGDIILPVNPTSIETKSARAVKNEEVDGVGETSHHNGTKLTRVEMRDVLLLRDDDWTLTDGKWVSPESVIEYFQGLIHDGGAVRLLVTESVIDGIYTLDEFDYDIKGGEPGDYYIRVLLVESRDGADASGGGGADTGGGGSGPALVDTSGEVVSYPTTSADGTIEQVRIPDGLGGTILANPATVAPHVGIHDR